MSKHLFRGIASRPSDDRSSERWGAGHGVLLSLYHVVRAKTPGWIADHRWYDSRSVRLASIAFTFLCVTIGWVPFMLPLKAAKMLALMFGIHQ